MRRGVLVVSLGGLFLLPTHARIVSAAADNPLEGVWQVMDVGGQAAAGVYIFTGKHYSMMFATTDRPQIDDTSKATADELRAMWGPMAANAGTYDVSGNLVTIMPIVAKIPVVMKQGANEVYGFQVEGGVVSGLSLATLGLNTARELSLVLPRTVAGLAFSAARVFVTSPWAATAIWILLV